MKSYVFVFALLLTTTASSIAQPALPDWVSAYKAGQALQDVRPAVVSMYWGIGFSVNSAEEADQMARREFARNVSSKVDVTTLLSQEEKAGTFKEQFQLKITEVSSARMGGLTISERFKDNSGFYSLMLIPKDDYDRNFQEDVKREIARMRAESEKELAEKQLQLEKERKQAELDAERRRLADQEKARKKELYGPFYERHVPTRMINALTASTPNEIMIKASPVLDKSGTLFLAKKLWVMQAWGQLEARRDFELHNMETGLRVKLVDGPKAGHGLTASVGLVGYVVAGGTVEALTMDDLGNSSDANTGFSPFVSATYALPQVIFSHVSGTVDARHASFGINARPFFEKGTLGESIELLLQTDLIFNKNYRFDENEAAMIHAGVRFNTGSNFSSVISVENMRRVMITLEIR